MANRLYEQGREAFARGQIDWVGATVRALLVDLADYTPNTAVGGDDNLDDIPAGARVATSAPLTGKTATGGVCDAADVTFTSVSGDVAEAIVLFVDSGTPSTSRLIAIIDTATGLPVTPDGNNIAVTWDNGANRIFRL
ncbi:hypothetical protein [Micromonospora sp. NPDC049645]|uniref:hypothetical protein n=1 Tax=Micromonospora sp. NPDC049645 TaxID=3155508 RepID=UPI00343C74F9